MKKPNTRLAEIFNTDLKQVQCIGEDGDMAVNCKTKLGAFRKFKAFVKETCGEEDAGEMTIDNVGIGSLHLTTPKDREDCGEEDAEWCVDYTKRGEFEVWVYQY